MVAQRIRRWAFNSVDTDEAWRIVDHFATMRIYVRVILLPVIGIVSVIIFFVPWSWELKALATAAILSPTYIALIGALARKLGQLAAPSIFRRRFLLSRCINAFGAVASATLVATVL